MKTLLALALLCMGSVGHAEDKFLLTVTSDMAPGKEGYLGVSVDAHNRVQEILFKDPFQKKSRFKLADLKELKLVLEIMHFDVLWLQAEENKDHSVSVTIQYLYNRLKLMHSKNSMEVTIRFNPQMATQQVIDEETHRVISSAHVVTNRMGRVPVGIYDIETR